MIIKCRSTTVRHVSRTHRVALDWLFDRINLNPKIQIRHIYTKSPLADMCTEGSFTRDEWNDLLHFFLKKISHYSSTCCTKNFSLINWSTMAKRIQSQKEEGVVSTSRPAVMVCLFILLRLSAASSPTASRSPWMPIASGRPNSRMSIEPSSFDAASTPQVRRKDAYLGRVDGRAADRPVASRRRRKLRRLRLCRRRPAELLHEKAAVFFPVRHRRHHSHFSCSARLYLNSPRSRRTVVVWWSFAVTGGSSEAECHLGLV